MHRTWKIEPNDVLLGIIGTVGAVCKVPLQFEPFTVHRNIAVLRGKQDQLRNAYLFHFLQGSRFLVQIEGATRQTAQPAIFLSQLSQLRIAAPSLCEQDRIVYLGAKLDNYLISEVSFRDKLQRLRFGLMADLLNGRVRVPEEAEGVTP
jgi:type I restriction enzyme S subunit